MSALAMFCSSYTEGYVIFFYFLGHFKELRSRPRIDGGRNVIGEINVENSIRGVCLQINILFFNNRNISFY